jgi:hypothetical protein
LANDRHSHRRQRDQVRILTYGRLFPFADHKRLDPIGREAVGLALTDMVREGSASRDRAGELAAMVLRENGRKLYALKNCVHLAKPG